MRMNIKIECLTEPKHFLLSRFASYFCAPHPCFLSKREGGSFRECGVHVRSSPHPSVHRFDGQRDGGGSVREMRWDPEGRRNGLSSSHSRSRTNFIWFTGY
ncbi:hypothetical protein CEXT_276401 [Caerostris extrusa]|uniref:Uncharacterized protein n=1 Tax=Caerostris extrusa TaxID=172846 RepID=A0AAV4PC75_CAEEX|nr:hypothetical protein CEXT_276401 [Caerostris extrusa]